MTPSTLTARWKGWAPQMRGLFRFVAAFLFMLAGTAKLFAFPTARRACSKPWAGSCSCLVCSRVRRPSSCRVRWRLPIFKSTFPEASGPRVVRGSVRGLRGSVQHSRDDHRTAPHRVGLPWICPSRRSDVVGSGWIGGDARDVRVAVCTSLHEDPARDARAARTLGWYQICCLVRQ
jgi:hypothetical protein